MIAKLLTQKKIRDRLLFHLKQDYFHELKYSIPLGHNYWAHILENDAYDSFSEIFIQQEYKDFLPKTIIEKIIDIGSNYGYFSLWIQSQNPKTKIFSLMIEPSIRCQRSLKNLVSQPILEGRYKYINKAIANPKSESVDFYDRPFMASSILQSSTYESSILVEPLKEKDLYNDISPPFDLIKCDIEGAEWEFLINYPKVIKDSKYLLLEWHSWHSGGGGLRQIVEYLASIDLEVIKTTDSAPATGRSGEVGLLLAKNKILLN